MRADDILWSKGLQGVRATKEVYIGDGGADHLVWEILDNALDEVRAKRATTVGIYMSNNEVTVWDDGQGIPTDIHTEAKIPGVQLVFQELHAGTKNKEGGESVHGLHGMGAAVVNALSSRLEVITFYKNKWHRLVFEYGILTCPLAVVSAPTDPIQQQPLKKGTLVRFVPDSKILPEKISVQMIADGVKFRSYFLPGATLLFGTSKKCVSLKGKPSGAYFLDHGPLSMVSPLQTFRTDSFDVSILWSAGDKNIVGAVNGVPCGQGNHIQAVKQCVVDFFAAKKFKMTEIEAGLWLLVNARPTSCKLRFDSQAKTRLVTKLSDLIATEIEPDLAKYLKKNATAILARIESDRDRKVTEKAAKLLGASVGQGKLPEKLVISTTRNNAKRELYVIEGDSAMGTARRARQAEFQDVLPLKGKIPNIYKNDKAIANEEIANLLQAVGYNPKLNDPLSRLRVGKIIIMSDPDIDGAHITNLVLSLLWKTDPAFFARKMVYYVDVPLFTAAHAGKRFYADTLAELRERLPKNYRMEHVTRVKGYGEINAEDLEGIAFTPATRRLVPVESPVSEAEFLALVSPDSGARKDLLGVRAL